MRISFEQIDSSDFILIDLTEKGVGIGIEAGYAYAKQIPIITIAQEESNVSNTLKGLSKRVFLYKDITDLDKILEDDGIKNILGY